MGSSPSRLERDLHARLENGVHANSLASRWLKSRYSPADEAVARAHLSEDCHAHLIPATRGAAPVPGEPVIALLNHVEIDRPPRHFFQVGACRPQTPCFPGIFSRTDRQEVWGRLVPRRSSKDPGRYLTAAGTSRTRHTTRKPRRNRRSMSICAYSTSDSNSIATSAEQGTSCDPSGSSFA